MSTDQRRSKRFDLKLRMQLLRCGSKTMEESAHTANVSSNGVLFHSDLKAAVGDAVEYVLTLTPELGPRKPVKIYCMGKVVRQDEETRTAATLERYEFLKA